MDLISIIVPFYNVANYIDTCIESIINQTYKNLEIIIINDGSQDGSARIVESHASSDNRIKYIEQENQGLSEARNVGVQNSTGKYIIFVDSDDELALDHVEFLHKLITTHDVGIACCREMVVKEDKSQHNYCLETEDKLYDNLEELLHDLFLYKTPTNTAWCKIFKRELVEKIPFKKGIIYEDLDIMYKLYKEAGRVYCSPQTKYYYNVRNNSIMNANFNDKKWSLFTTIEEIKKFIINNNMNILDDYGYFCTKTLLDIYKNISFSDYKNKKAALKKAKELLLEFEQNARNSNRMEKREKILMSLIKCPNFIYKFFIMLYAKIRRSEC